jgi:hypothetical protein
LYLAGSDIECGYIQKVTLIQGVTAEVSRPEQA